jgi:hypothetical protein
VWTLVCIFKILSPTIWDHIQKGIFVVKCLGWVSHALDSVTKRDQMTMTESFLKTFDRRSITAGPTSRESP